PRGAHRSERSKTPKRLAIKRASKRWRWTMRSGFATKVIGQWFGAQSKLGGSDHEFRAGSLRYCFERRAMMELARAPAFVAAKMALLSDARAPAVTRADELTAQISHTRDRLNGRVWQEGDDPAELRIELDRLLAEQKTLQRHRPIENDTI